jgi:hypothetical protein
MPLVGSCAREVFVYFPIKNYTITVKFRDILDELD